MSSFQKYEDSSLGLIDLHSACRMGDLESIKRAYNVEPEKLNSKDAGLGWAPIYRTVICGHYEGTEYLLKQGANPNITNSLGETPLHQAADNSQEKFARLLLEYKADPNAQQNDGDTPLHHAAFRGDAKMLSLLMEYSGNPNLPNFMFGRTPLHYAVDSGNCDCISVLVNLGGDPSVQDKQGKSAFDLNHDQEVQAVLRATPVVDEFSEVNTSSFQYPVSEDIHSPNATNFISDAGDDRPMFDTFGIDKIKKALKETFQLKPIFNWLKDIGLEELYEIMCEAGYDEVKAMTNQMLGPLPITDEDLRNNGISKPGHRMRIIMKLEQEAGLIPKLRLKKNAENSGLLNCCMAPNNATHGFAVTSLREWLENLEISKVYQNFTESGFDDYESLILMMSVRPINSKFLEDKIKISESEYRIKILKKLEKDLKNYYSTYSVINISFDEPQSVACESCQLF